jgi:2-methylisocitrate lyase-like PEP mutase family enzyme
MMTQIEKAERFRLMHHGKHMLVLPNAWDVPSSRLFEEVGFPAVATSSAGMMVSLGYQDGETIPRQEYIEAVRRIGKAVSVPFSVDVVAGFGRTPKEVSETVQEVVHAGAVGINIEDFDHATKKLFSADAQVEKLYEIMTIAEKLGIPIVLNARTDAFKYAEGDEEDRFNEAIERGKMYREAGADCVYPMGLTLKNHIKKYINSVNSPVNVMVRKGLPSISELEEIGVARLSFGPSASYAVMGFLKRVCQEILAQGNFEGLIKDIIDYDELNRLALPKTPTT